VHPTTKRNEKKKGEEKGANPGSKKRPGCRTPLKGAQSTTGRHDAYQSDGKTRDGNGGTGATKKKRIEAFVDINSNTKVKGTLVAAKKAKSDWSSKKRDSSKMGRGCCTGKKGNRSPKIQPDHTDHS